MPAGSLTAAWKTSSRSDDRERHCVEVAQVPAIIAVRDTKARASAQYAFPASAWSSLLDATQTR